MNTIKITLLSVVCFFLVNACSTKKAHIFARFAQEQQIEEISDILTNNEYEIEVNRHYFPSDIYHHTVIYSPTHIQHDDFSIMLSELESALDSSLATRFVGSGNHTFTQSNIGIYIVSSDFKQETNQVTVPFATEYTSTYCETLSYAYLTLKDNGSFFIESGIENNHQQTEELHQGQWQQQDNQLVLTKEGLSKWVFEIHTISEATKYGPRVGWRLTPDNKSYSLDNCRFEITIVLRD